jgi:hypothetical protein
MADELAGKPQPCRLFTKAAWLRLALCHAFREINRTQFREACMKGTTCWEKTKLTGE